jgi:hypothetical protein
MTMPADARRPLAGRKITIADLKLKTPPAPLEPVKAGGQARSGDAVH